MVGAAADVFPGHPGLLPDKPEVHDGPDSRGVAAALPQLLSGTVVTDSHLNARPGTNDAQLHLSGVVFFTRCWPGCLSPVLPPCCHWAEGYAVNIGIDIAPGVLLYLGVVCGWLLVRVPCCAASKGDAWYEQDHIPAISPLRWLPCC
jgi:hypothetical protein